MVVVVPEHRDDRRRRALARRAENARLLDEPVRRQIAGEQDELDVLHGGEHPPEMLAVLVRRMEVADGGDTQLAHGAGLPASVFALPRRGVRPQREPAPTEDFPELVETMKRAGAALREAGVVHSGAGSRYGRAAGPDRPRRRLLPDRGGRRPRARGPGRGGLPPERPPEHWLFKAWDDDILVDLVFHPAGGP